MHLDKKQLPQLIVLGVMVMLCIGYVSFTLVGSAKKVAAPAQVSVTKVDKALDSSEINPAAAQVQTESMGVFPSLASVPMRRDPFLPQRMPGEVSDVRNTRPVVVRPSVKQMASARVSRSFSSSVPPINPFRDLFGAVSSASQPGTEKTAPVKIVEADPQFVLTGVICGQKNVAIIRVGDSGRYVVKEGQLVDGRYRVQSVTDNGAVLVHKNRRIELKLGGVKNAS